MKDPLPTVTTGPLPASRRAALGRSVARMAYALRALAPEAQEVEAVILASEAVRA